MRSSVGEEWPERKLHQLEESAVAGFAAMADVPERRVTVKFLAGPEARGDFESVKGRHPGDPSISKQKRANTIKYRRRSMGFYR